ncbi:EmrB/QacA subfamily drug resistance transporter [Antricoccus suffuscus]|uniref:EmrB/QacA subfamily drug resistance transporter n=2 Tax=Antricoccus suffuscus TaxID=1629062 RepID=A0A2T0ZVR8_9ACTN|nr:EmrB/QacA subfamily drug resistance transporter [Antricoccus suffuscus]
MTVMSVTLVSVALPDIGRDLPANATDLQWIVDGYIIVYASLLVACGVAGDRFGRKGVFIVGIALFATGSLVAGLAPSIAPLLIGRVIQGLGPAIVIPGSVTIIRALFDDPRQRALALGLWSTGSGVAMAVGPAVGGAIVDAVGWRWVFLINVPLGIVMLLVSIRYIPKLGRSSVRARFDWTGVALTTVGIACLAFAIIEGQDHGWTSPLILTAFVVGAAAMAAFILVERQITEPLINLDLFRRPSFTASNVAGFVVFFVYIGIIVYFSVFLQQVAGYSAIAAGLGVSSLGLAFAVVGPLAGFLVGRLGAHWPLTIGLVIIGCATLTLLRLTPDTGIAGLWWMLAIFGFGIGLSLTPMTAISISAVDAEHAGMASAVLNAVRQIGQVLGVAVFGVFAYGHLSTTTTTGHVFSHADGAAFVSGLRVALLISGIAVLVTAALGVVLFRRDRPDRANESTPDLAHQEQRHG